MSAHTQPNVPQHIDFGGYTEHVPPELAAAVLDATERFHGKREIVVSELEEWEDLRQVAHELRSYALQHLDECLVQLEQNITEAGGHVHWAKDAAEARAIVLALAQKHDVKSVVKAKSMATEEIGLNAALQEAGIRVMETDLGEFIIQLKGVGPSHIIVPALHLTRHEVAKIFTETLGVDAPPDPERLTQIARDKLREEFLSAGMGISGANFLIAETGTLVVVTNEGNGRMCTTLPDVHVAVAGIDKVVPDWDTLTVMLKLLARSATGQKMSTYTSFITGPRQTEAENGAREFHLVLLDNGRRRMLEDPITRETLRCIRCGACLNICPVYRNVGGYAYGWVYSGPIGAMLVPQLLGMERASELPFASTLCGACADVCPVKIPIPEVLLHLRRRVADGDHVEGPTIASTMRMASQTSATVLSRPWLYRVAKRMAMLAQAPFRRGEWLPNLPPPFSRWTKVRPFPAFKMEFQTWWEEHRRQIDTDVPAEPLEVKAPLPKRHSAPLTERPPILPPRQAGTSSEELDKLLSEIDKLDGLTRRLSPGDVDDALRKLVETQGVTQATLWTTPGLAALGIAERLQDLGVEIVPPSADKHALAEVDLGITEVDFAVPETGTLGLFSSPDKPRMVSLLPPVHLAIMRPEALRADLHQVFAEAKSHGYLIFISGASRTADIELVLTLGVHGPKTLYVWVVEE